MIGPEDAQGDDQDRSIMVPEFQGEGTLDDTLVAGSMEMIPPGATMTREGQVINYYFPVEIEIVGTLDEEQMNTVANHVFRAMAVELSSRA